MQVQRTAVTEMLRPAEEALIEQKGVLECICMPPILASPRSRLRCCPGCTAGRPRSTPHARYAANGSWAD